MTVNTQTSRMPAYTGNGVTTAFAFTFKIFNASDLQVYVNGVLVTTGYSVAINPTQDGGTVTFVVPPVNGAVILLIRMLDLTQPADVPVEDKLPEGTLNNAFDKAVMLIQQLQEQLNRSFKRSVTSLQTFSLDLPDAITGRVLKWGPSGLVNSAYDPDLMVVNAAAFASAANTSAVSADSSADLAAYYAGLTTQTNVPDPTGQGSKVPQVNAGGTAYVLITVATLLAKAFLAKGDLFVGASSGIGGRLPVGADGKVLAADSAQALGLSYVSHPFSKEYISSDIPIDSAAINTFTHALSVKPKFAFVTLVCTAPDQGYAIGDEIQVIGQQDRGSGAGSSTNDWGCAIRLTTTKVEVIVARNGFMVPSLASIYEWQPITGSSWTLRVRAWA